MRPAIPAPPQIRRAPIAKLCVISALAIVGPFVVLAALEGESGCPSTACTLALVGILGVPLVVTIVAAALAARITRRIAMPARIWLSVAVAAGFVAGVLIGSVIEGNDEASALLLIPLVVPFAAPFPFVVISIVSWVSEARGAGGKASGAPERPDALG